LFGFSAQTSGGVGPGAVVDPAFAAQWACRSRVAGRFLFPDTYQLPPQITAEGLRDFLLQTFLEKVGHRLF
jgi:hypothetical protein